MTGDKNNTIISTVAELSNMVLKRGVLSKALGRDTYVLGVQE